MRHTETTSQRCSNTSCPVAFATWAVCPETGRCAACEFSAQIAAIEPHVPEEADALWFALLEAGPDILEMYWAKRRAREAARALAGLPVMIRDSVFALGGGK
jgi:hypothetical protein